MSRGKAPLAPVALWCVQGSSCTSQHQELPLQPLSAQDSGGAAAAQPPWSQAPPSSSVQPLSTTLQGQALPPSPPKSKGESLTVPGLLQLQLGTGSGLRGAVVLPLLGLRQTADKIHTGGENCRYWWVGAILNTPSDTPRFKE